jgi:CheY-like chemotaxis protein
MNKSEQASYTLVVEDDFPSQRLMQAFLRDKHEMLFATNAKQAREHLMTHNVAVVLLDLSLEGGTNGLELCKWIRSSAEHRRIPVIATTAHAFPSDRERCLEAGCDRVLTKPLNRKMLIATIEELCS